MPGRYLLLPAPLALGTEEQSSRARALSQRIPSPWVELASEDAAALGAADGDLVEVLLDGLSLVVPLRHSPGLPRGVARLPRDLPGLEAGLGHPAAGLDRDPSVPGGPMTPWLALEVVVLFSVVMGMATAMIWVERRLLGLVQERVGAEPGRSVRAAAADRRHDQAPHEGGLGAAVRRPAAVRARPADRRHTAILAFAVIPITPALGIVDLDVGLLFFLGMGSLSVYSALVGGLASNSKYSLLGGLRAAAQMVELRGVHGAVGDGRRGPRRLVRPARHRARAGRRSGSWCTSRSGS